MKGVGAKIKLTVARGTKSDVLEVKTAALPEQVQQKPEKGHGKAVPAGDGKKHERGHGKVKRK